MLTRNLASSALAALGALLPVAALAAAGDLDTSFGASGFHTLAPECCGQTGAYATAAQYDGKVLVAGTAQNGAGFDPVVVRFNADGTLDTAFGASGIARISLGAAFDGSAVDVAVQSDGRIVVAGVRKPKASALPRHSVLVRLNASGTLDTAFGTAGIASVGPFAEGSPLTEIRRLLPLADGKLILAGRSQRSLGDARVSEEMFVARVAANGTLDDAFGANGLAFSSGAGTEQFNVATDAAIAPDGSIYVVGVAAAGNDQSGSAGLVMRVLANGSVDPAFGTNGLRRFPLAAETMTFTSLAVQSDGKLLIGANIDYSPTVLRLQAWGQPDVAYGAGGRVSVATTPERVFAQAGNQALLLGYTYVNGRPVVSAKRLNADGSEDPGYALANAPAVVSSGRGGFGAFAVSGSTVVAVTNAREPDAIVAYRLNASGSQDAAFGTQGAARLPAALASPAHVLGPVVISATDAITFARPAPYPSTSGVLLARVTPGGQADATYGTQGRSFVNVTGNPWGLFAAAEGKQLLGAGASVHRVTAGGALDGGFASPSLQVEANPYVATYADGRFLFGHSGQAARYLAGGAIDASFNSGRPLVPASGRWSAAAATADGGAVLAGQGTQSPERGFVQKHDASGALVASFGGNAAAALDFSHATFITGVQALADGRVIVVGYTSGYPESWDEQLADPRTVFAVRLLADGQPDPTFGASGVARLPSFGQRVTPRGMAVQADGRLVISGVDGWHGPNRAWAARLNADGSLDASFGSQGVAMLDTSGADVANFVGFTADGGIVLAGQFVSTGFAKLAGVAAELSLTPSSIDFGAQSMGTTSTPRTIAVTNRGPGSVTIASVSASPQFVQTHDCRTLAVNATCTILASFAPAAADGALNSSVAVSGALQISGNASSSPQVVTLRGSAEKSLVVHFYSAILARPADDGGKAFWQSEAARVAALGADPNEAWYAMATAFYSSAEYTAQRRSDADFVADLYDSFLNRLPDSAGLAYWTEQLANGLPREAVLAALMLSPEFSGFSQRIFGSKAVAAENSLVMDFYRGLLGRLPDDSGYRHWTGRFRSARCGGLPAVENEARAIAGVFLSGPEYAGRGRSKVQLVADLYNAFMRRGADLAGLRHWAARLDDGSLSRDALLQQFIASAEFQARLSQVAAQGC